MDGLTAEQRAPSLTDEQKLELEAMLRPGALVRHSRALLLLQKKGYWGNAGESEEAFVKRCLALERAGLGISEESEPEPSPSELLIKVLEVLVGLEPDEQLRILRSAAAFFGLDTSRDRSPGGF